MKTRLAALALTTAALAACSDDPDGPPIELPEPIVVDGRYAMATELDLQASAALPPQLAEAIDLLRGLRDQPGATLFEVADRAGVPAVDIILGALPGPVEDRLFGWIDGYVDGVLRDNPELAGHIDLAIAAADSVLAVVHIESELETGGGAEVEHRLSALRFDAAGSAVRFEVGGQPLTRARASARVELDLAGSRLVIGDHGFGLPIGTLAYQVFEGELERRTGSDLRGLLADAFDCPGLAADVADQCVLGTCVGHQGNLLALCDGGLDGLADELRARFVGADLDVLRLSAGQAQLVDRDGDLAADALSGGLWTAVVDVGMGPRPARATFAAVRR